MMKKLITVFCMTIFILSGCPSPITMKNVYREPNFSGIIINVSDNSILVKVTEGEEPLQSGDLIYVSLDVKLKDSTTTFMSADEIIVYFDGTILKNYPVQVNVVYAIFLTSKCKREPWIDTVGMEILHIEGHQAIEWATTEKQEIDMLYSWFIELSLTKKQFAQGQSPKDLGFVVIYNFTLIIGQHYSWNEKNGFTVYEYGRPFSFTYGNFRGEWYLLYYDEWFLVNNPTIPMQF